MTFLVLTISGAELEDIGMEMNLAITSHTFTTHWASLGNVRNGSAMSQNIFTAIFLIRLAAMTIAARCLPGIFSIASAFILSALQAMIILLALHAYPVSK